MMRARSTKPLPPVTLLGVHGLCTVWCLCNGSIHLKSNLTLAVDEGAVLKFAFPNADPSLLVGANLENVKIYGPGTLDGAGNACITPKRCENVHIRNLKVYRGGDSAILAEGCDGVLIDNVDIRTGGNGIRLSEGRDVRVTDCRIDAVRREYGRRVGGGEAIKVSVKDARRNSCQLSVSVVGAVGNRTYRSWRIPKLTVMVRLETAPTRELRKFQLIVVAFTQ